MCVCVCVCVCACVRACVCVGGCATPPPVFLVLPLCLVLTSLSLSAYACVSSFAGRMAVQDLHTGRNKERQSHVIHNPFTAECRQHTRKELEKNYMGFYSRFVFSFLSFLLDFHQMIHLHSQGQKTRGKKITGDFIPSPADLRRDEWRKRRDTLMFMFHSIFYWSTQGQYPRRLGAK